LYIHFFYYSAATIKVLTTNATLRQEQAELKHYMRMPHHTEKSMMFPKFCVILC